MQLLQRNGQVLSNTAQLSPASSFNVRVMKPGAVVDGASVASPITVFAGHGFAVGDKFITQGGVNGTITASIRTVTAVGATSITYSGAALSLDDRDVLINIGADTNGNSATPAYDNLGTTVYAEPTTATAVTNSKVTANSDGEYHYWYRQQELWEVVFDTDDDPVDAILDATKRGNHQVVINTITDADATPSVKGGTVFVTANTAPTTITDFDDGVIGQQITVIIGDANTTIDFTGTNLKGNVGVDWTPTANDHMTCIYDGTSWYCDISDNTA